MSRDTVVVPGLKSEPSEVGKIVQAVLSDGQVKSEAEQHFERERTFVEWVYSIMAGELDPFAKASQIAARANTLDKWYRAYRLMVDQRIAAWTDDPATRASVLSELDRIGGY